MNKCLSSIGPCRQILSLGINWKCRSFSSRNRKCWQIHTVSCKIYQVTSLFLLCEDLQKLTYMSAYWLVNFMNCQSHWALRFLKLRTKSSLVAQWLRNRLPMQRTRVKALVWEDPACCGTTKPVRHNYWACALEPVSHNYWARTPQLLKPTCLEPVLCNKRSHHNEKSMHSN